MTSAESHNLEYKASWQDDYLKWICGFANADGGRIIFGKDDNGSSIGLAKSKKLLEDLPNKIRDQLGLAPKINLTQEDGKDLIEIIVEPSTVPISLRGSYYWRSGSVKQELKGHTLTDFLMKKTGMTWDKAIEEKASLDDIDPKAVERFKDDASHAGRLPDLSKLSTKETLKKLRLLTKEGLTRAAIVLFGKDPGEFYTNLFVKIGRFGESVVDMKFQEVCEGCLIFMLDDVMEQLEKKFLIKPVRFEGLRRIEELEYPVPALREMLLNALVHRNYTGSMTQLKVFDGKLSLWNAGALPTELSIEKLFQLHESFPRNPLIADVCYKAGYIDSWGRGVEKITDACTQAGLPAPVFEERFGGLAVELSKAEVSTSNLGDRLGEKEGNREGNREGDREGDFSLQQLTENRKIILTAMRQNPKISQVQLAEELGITPANIEKNIRFLKEHGLIARVGPAFGGHWKVLGDEVAE